MAFIFRNKRKKKKNKLRKISKLFSQFVSSISPQKNYACFSGKKMCNLDRIFPKHSSTQQYQLRLSAELGNPAPQAQPAP